MTSNDETHSRQTWRDRRWFAVSETSDLEQTLGTLERNHREEVVLGQDNPSARRCGYHVLITVDALTGWLSVPSCAVGVRHTQLQANGVHAMLPSHS
jgi:hypothetical protein